MSTKDRSGGVLHNSSEDSQCHQNIRLLRCRYKMFVDYIESC